MSALENAGGVLIILLYIGRIAAWVGSGVIAWDWVSPESFWGAILFLFAWGALGFVLNIVFGLLFAGIGSLSE